MKAMILNRVCDLRENRDPLALGELPAPVPGEKDAFTQAIALHEIPHG